MACNSINLAFSNISSQDACINAYSSLNLLRYVDGTDLSDSTTIYMDSGCTVLSTPGFYSDGANVAQLVVDTLTNYGECSYSNSLRNCCDSVFSEDIDIFEFTNINMTNAKTEKPVIYMEGFSDTAYYAKKIRFKNIQLPANSKIVVKNAQDVLFENVQTDVGQKPVYEITECFNIKY
jgi:hypothetical protein